MERQNFIKTIATGTFGSLIVGANRREQQSNIHDTGGGVNQPRMVVGCQSRTGTSTEDLEFLARHGVYHMGPGSPTSIELDTGIYTPEEEGFQQVPWDLDIALRQVEEADKFGIKIEAFHLSGGGSHFDLWRNIMLGNSPERDRELESMAQMIEISAKAGVHLLLYNATILPVLRTSGTPDPNRGNVSYRTWNYEQAVEQGMHEEPHEAAPIDIDEMFERISYWLERILPVAEENKVKLACHIADPPLPAGFRGITRWNSPDIFEGIKRFARLSNSPAHGFNFCIGTTAEGLENPREEIYPIIEWLGERNQIFNVHYRNIRGGWNNFQEVFPDNGDMDFVGVLQALKDVGYAGMVMPDHIPDHDDPASNDQGFAFVYGYTKALLQLMYGFDAYPDHALDLKAPGFAIHYG